MSSFPTIWTPQEDEMLRSLRDTGLSFTLIAQQIGKSRNACIGRAGRIGIPKVAKPIEKVGYKWSPEGRAALANRQKRSQTAKYYGLPAYDNNSSFDVRALESLPKRKAKSSQERAMLIQAIDDVTHESSERVSLAALKDNQCHWPFGEGPYFYCGAPKCESHPSYCEHHAMRSVTREYSREERQAYTAARQAAYVSAA